MQTGIWNFTLSTNASEVEIQEVLDTAALQSSIMQKPVHVRVLDE